LPPGFSADVRPYVVAFEDDAGAVIEAFGGQLCPGKGDKVVDRLCRQLHVAPPLVRVSDPAKTELFAIGGMPLSDKPNAQTGKAAGQLVSVATWVQQPALVVKGGNPRREAHECR
jgi:hypothetical protein